MEVELVIVQRRLLVQTAKAAFQDLLGKQKILEYCIFGSMQKFNIYFVILI